MAAAVETITTTCHRLVQCITATIGIKTVEISTCQTCNPSESTQTDKMVHQIRVVMSKHIHAQLSLLHDLHVNISVNRLFVFLSFLGMNMNTLPISPAIVAALGQWGLIGNMNQNPDQVKSNYSTEQSLSLRRKRRF